MSVESAPAEDLRMDVGALFGALWARLLRIILVTALLLAATFVILMFVPKLYESSASLLVEDRTSTFTQAAGTTATAPDRQRHHHRCADVEPDRAGEVARHAAGGDRQPRSSARSPSSTAARSSPITMLLRLVGRNTEPQERRRDRAAKSQRAPDRRPRARLRGHLDLCALGRPAARRAPRQRHRRRAREAPGRAVARRHRRGTVRGSSSRSTMLRAKVQQADAAVAQYRSDNGIFAGTNGTTLPDQQISDIGRQITDAQGRRNTAEQRASLIRSLLKAGQPVEGVDDVRSSSPSIQSLMQIRATFQGDAGRKARDAAASSPDHQGAQRADRAGQRADQRRGQAHRRRPRRAGHHRRRHDRIAQRRSRPRPPRRIDAGQGQRRTRQPDARGQGTARPPRLLPHPLSRRREPHRCRLGAARRPHHHAGRAVRRAGLAQDGADPRCRRLRRAGAAGRHGAVRRADVRPGGL